MDQGQSGGGAAANQLESISAKIKAIKDVRSFFTDLTLKEAKELVEKAPLVLKEEEDAKAVLE